MALYPPAVKKLIAPGVNDPRITARAVILHVAATEAGSLFNYFNGPSNGIESHFYVTRTGGVEQYRDTAFQADANRDANAFAISIETQGMAAGEWTPEQLASLRALIRWCHAVHGIPIVRCATWDGSGVGYHSQFTQWAGDGRTCPGPDRIRQIPALIASAAASGSPAPTPPATPPGGLTVADINTLTAQLDQALAAIGSLASAESDRYLTATARQRWLEGALNTIIAKVGADPVDEAALAKVLAAELVPSLTAVVQSMTPGSADAEQVRQATEAAIRSVLGGLDSAPPAA